MSTKRNNRNTLAVVLIGAGAITVAGLGFFASGPSANKVPSQDSRTELPPVTVTVKPDQDPSLGQKVIVLTPVLEDEGYTFKQASEDVPAGEDPVLFSCRQLVAQFTNLPEGAGIKSVKVTGSEATVDFTEAVASGMGSAEEGALVNGILTTLGQFKQIDNVRFTVGGAPIETLGHLELDGPQPVERP